VLFHGTTVIPSNGSSILLSNTPSVVLPHNPTILLSNASSAIQTNTPPDVNPTILPSDSLSAIPSNTPFYVPSHTRTGFQSKDPSVAPSHNPTDLPLNVTSAIPSNTPSDAQSNYPTILPPKMVQLVIQLVFHPMVEEQFHPIPHQMCILPFLPCLGKIHCPKNDKPNYNRHQLNNSTNRSSFSYRHSGRIAPRGGWCRRNRSSW